MKKKNALDTEELVVLRDTLAPCGSTRLDLADTERDDEVGNDGVLGLTATVGDHDTPAIGLRKLSTIGGSS